MFATKKNKFQSQSEIFMQIMLIHQSIPTITKINERQLNETVLNHWSQLIVIWSCNDQDFMQNWKNIYLLNGWHTKETICLFVKFKVCNRWCWSCSWTCHQTSVTSIIAEVSYYNFIKHNFIIFHLYLNGTAKTQQSQHAYSNETQQLTLLPFSIPMPAVIYILLFLLCMWIQKIFN